MGIWFAPSVYADGIITVPTTSQPDTSPLIITSYKTINTGTNIGFIQIYNDGDSLQDLSAWTITATDAANNSYSVMLDARPGYIEPGTHVIIEQNNAVSGIPSSGDRSETFVPEK